MTTSNSNVGAPASGAMSRVQNAPYRPRVASPKDKPMKQSSYRLALVVACASVTLSACSGGRSEAEELVRSGLKDPESARFGEFYFNKETKKACLTVNAKNSMGGYTGDQQFALRRDDEGWTYVDDNEESPTDCRERYADKAN